MSGTRYLERCLSRTHYLEDTHLQWPYEGPDQLRDSQSTNTYIDTARLTTTSDVHEDGVLTSFSQLQHPSISGDVREAETAPGPA